MRRTLLSRFLLSAVLAGLQVSPASAASSVNKAPVMFAAENLRYDQENAIVQADGRVEIIQGQRILLADSLVYDQQLNTVIARGNISIVEPDGNVFFAQEVELQDNLKSGVVRYFQARLNDDSLFAAKEARRVNEHIVKLKKAVYSPCRVCEEEPVPLWQIKADAVKIDQKSQSITYHDAFFEVHGVPVMYTPYLKHATPNADRKSGLLRGRYRASNNLGAMVSVPYYFNIAPNMDFTLTTTLTSGEGPYFAGEWRHLTPQGRYRLFGSITYPQQRDINGNRAPGREIRGHIEGDGRFTLNDTWLWGFAGKRSTDDTYLRLYRFGYEDTLTSRIYLHGQRSRSFASVEGISFQGLNPEDDPDTTPLILPYIRMSHLSSPGYGGIQWFMEAGSSAISRHEGVNSTRVSVNPGLQFPYTTDSGHQFTLKGEVVADYYYVTEQPVTTLTGPDMYDGSAGRVMPQASLTWKYPLIRPLEGGRATVLEPTMQFVVSPHGNNPQEIPNEDSQTIDFSPSNLFSTNRFNGYDRVETGPRLNYGLQSLTTEPQGNFYRFFLGQSYAPSDSNTFPLSSDNSGYFSDFVGEAELGMEQFSLAYRFQLDRDGLSLQRNEINTRINWRALDLHLDYILLDDDPILPNKEEINTAFSYALGPEWQLTAQARRDLSRDGGMIYAGGSIVYKNECLVFTTSLEREFTRVREIEPSTSLSFQVSLKNL